MLDLFETRTMLESLEQMKPPRTFLLDTFFSTVNVSTTKHIDIDIIKGKRRMAPFVNPRLQGKVVEKRGRISRTYTPPYVKPKMVTTADDILEREPGKHIYEGNMSPAQMAAVEVGKNLVELDELITRREEWMAAQVLTTGKVVVVGEGVEDEIDFLMEPSHLPALLGTAKWTDHTNARPLQNLKTWKRLVAKDSGINPTEALMGLDALDNFLQCEEVIGTTGGGKNLFDMRRINIGQIDPRILPNGVIYYGYLTELGLDIWTYEDWFVDEYDNDKEKPMMPANKVVLGSPNAYTRRQYGAIQDLKATAAVRRFPKSWEEEDPSARMIMLQSAPLPCMHQVDAFLCAEVL